MTALLLLGLARASETSALPLLLDGAGDTAATAAVTSDTFLGLQLRGQRRVGTLGDGPVTAGVGLDLPVMLWVQGSGPDTGRAVLQVSAEPLRAGRAGLPVHVQTRLGVQVATLSTVVPWELDLAVVPGLHLGSRQRGFLGIDLGWRQGLTTLVVPREAGREPFEGLDAEARTGFVALPSSRYACGLAFSTPVSGTWHLMGSGTFVGTVKRYDAGPLDTMMFGVWPFFMELGLASTW